MLKRPALWLALACLLVFILAPILAFAAEAVPAPTLVIPWGTWVLELAHIASAILVPIAVTYLGYLVKRASPFLSVFLTNALIDRMVNLAVDFALASIAGAAKGRTVSVAVAPALITLGAQRAVDTTLPWIVARAGGVNGIAERVFRRLDLDPAASSENALSPALDALAAGVPGSALVPSVPTA